MTKRAGFIAVVLAIGACGAEGSAPPDPIASPSASLSPSAEPSPSPDPSPSPEPSPEPEPAAMPKTFAADVGPQELLPEDLIPEGADVTGEWFAFTENPTAVMVLVAWVEPGEDFSRLPRGFAVWRRYASRPHWRADLIERHGARDAIQEIQISLAEMTGDSSDDALVFEGLGGSGACGSWSVIDLARFEETYRRELCDGRIDPGPLGSPGLLVSRSIYREGDAHCCPSAVRETTLTWDGSAWRVTEHHTIER